MWFIHCLPIVLLPIIVVNNVLIISTSSYVILQPTLLKRKVTNIKLHSSDMNNEESDVTSTTTSVSTITTKNEEAQRLLDKVKQMRMEIATLTGTSIEDVEREASAKKQLQIDNDNKVQAERELMKANRSQQQQQSRQYIVPVPETIEEQILQARYAIERAYHDNNVTKQIVRFAFVPTLSNDNNNNFKYDTDIKMNQNIMFVRNDQDWPGGIQQIYREATQPYTKYLLQQLRIRNRINNNIPFQNNKPNDVREQILWDFDGSALMTATRSDVENSSSGKPVITSFVQALIQPNTDNRYFNDIIQMNERLDQYRNTQPYTTPECAAINLIINPFWSNVTSWGYNIFQPKAQQRATEIIFSENDSYIETYSIITKTVRGEDCIAIKAYPYDWQLYAYIETNDRLWSSIPYTTIHLGSSITEPSVADFAALISQRSEFQYSKNMRQMQRK